MTYSEEGKRKIIVQNHLLKAVKKTPELRSHFRSSADSNYLVFDSIQQELAVLETARQYTYNQLGDWPDSPGRKMTGSPEGQLYEYLSTCIGSARTELAMNNGKHEPGSEVENLEAKQAGVEGHGKSQGRV